MKKSLLLLLAGIMAVSANVQATTYSDKTYMNMRQPLNDLATEVSTWHASKAVSGENMFGGTVQVTGFYTQSQDRADAGNYFGTANEYATAKGAIQNFISVGMDPAGAAANTAALDSTDIAAGEVGLAANIVLSPRRTVGGARIDYSQKLNSLVEGLWFKVDMPIVSVEHRLDMKDSGTGNTTNTTGNPTTSKTVLDILSGNYSVPAGTANFTQVALNKAKLIKSRSASGVADINLQLGYNILHEEKYHLGLSVGLTIPTGNKPSGEFLFEPVYGSKHFALGAGFNGCWKFYHEGEFSARLLAKGDYRYQFKAEEIRTAGFKNVAGSKTQEFSQWVVLGKSTIAGATPAANALTQAMNVTPGSQFEGLLGLGVEWGNVVIDAGYNLFYRDAEDVSLKTAWADNTYGVWAAYQNVNTAYSLSGGTNARTTGINASTGAAQLTLDPCTTPQIVTHKVYAGLGYIFRDMETPVHLGLGGFYEFKGDNAALSNWAISGKIGVAF